MARFVVTAHSHQTPRTTWDALWDLKQHQRIIPFTTMTGSAVECPVEGSTFVARTGWKYLGFDDAMTLVRFRPPVENAPGEARVEKSGKVILGSIDVSVTPHGHGSKVVWNQQIRVRGMPDWTGPVVGLVARSAYGNVIRRLLRPRRA